MPGADPQRKSASPDMDGMMPIRIPGRLPPLILSLFFFFGFSCCWPIYLALVNIKLQDQWARDRLDH